ncbi:hypothetical protein [Metabacillus hrfriensis]|uniref:Uncharacterized protein n=1 Tax=Metabacillus hrfriensis TaxID=3048891 RepID=A0ACD4R5J8_9BACI|nr:hypothetical protein [Metabacillus sp. CT-WN-B3]WHZ55732.1 hypothetical protein QLQ22_13460 [Metabacillus sp. CT-WN-B3]
MNKKNIILKCYLILDKEFDLAIAYHTPASFPVVYVMNNIKAKTKVAWIHSDVSQYKRELIPYSKYYEKYDKIFCVSIFAMNKFVEMYPNLKEKTDVFYYIHDKEKIELLSLTDEGFNDNFAGTRILTIGRLNSQKGQDIIPRIIKELREQIEDGQTGKIINFDEDELNSAIRYLILNRDVCEKFISNLKRKNVASTSEIKKLYNCFC